MHTRDDRTTPGENPVRDAPDSNNAAFGMGRPIPMFTDHAPKRPPPLDLSQIPNDDITEFFADILARLRRLIAHAEHNFPLLARINRLVVEALAETRTPRGVAVWDSPPHLSE